MKKIIVDLSKLEEIRDGRGCSPMFEDERFYRIPDFSGYCLTNYGRLLKYFPEKDYWHKQSPAFDDNQNQYCYNIENQHYSILQIMAWVFLGNWNIQLYRKKAEYYITVHKNNKSHNDYKPFYYTFRLDNLVIIDSRDDLIYALQSKMQGKPITTKNYQKGLIASARMFP